MRILLIIIFLISVSFCAKAQTTFPTINVDLVPKKEETNKSFPSLNSILQSDFNIQNNSVPSIYSYKDLAFFCRMEVKIEKSAKVPFKFRLGDVRYVDYLEQKIDSY